MNAIIVRLFATLVIIVVALPRSVDAAAPAGHYVVSAGSGTDNGTVYDTKSKLTWQQTVSSTTYTWAAAKTYCAGVGTSLGGTGWRLPTMKELYSLVDSQSTTSPTIDSTAFPLTPSSEFWSASPSVSSSSDAWCVSFSVNVYPNASPTASSLYVRCVR
jgi:Protein of unknown function (DUF1566)